jgi:hypothetical protein
MAAATVCVLVGGISPAAGQQCIRVESEPPSATLAVRNGTSISKGSPADFCTLQPGFQYGLTVSRKGYEKRTLKFHFSDFGQPPKFSGVWQWMVFRSVVLPGWGQASMGYKARTFETAALLITDGFKVYQVWKHYDRTNTRYNAAVVLAETAESQEELERWTAVAHKLARDTNAYRKSVWLTAGLGAWVYLRNVLETYLLSAPPKATRLEGSDFKVAIPRRTTTRAVMRSLFFPGLGQQYAGHGGRAFIFHTGVFVLSLFTIDAKLRYDLAQVNYDLAIEAYNKANSVDEKQALVLDIALLKDGVEKRKDEMYAFAASTGLLWLTNVLEALASGGGGDVRDDRFEITSSYYDSTVRSGVLIRF